MNESNPFSRPPPVRDFSLAKCCICDEMIKRNAGVVINGYLTCAKYTCVEAILRRTEPPKP